MKADLKACLAAVLKAISEEETGAETEDAYYEFVEDSTELEVISKVFEQMLDDIDLKYE